MDTIKVHFDSLSSGAAAIASSHRALQATLDDLQKKLAPMVATWQGAAQQAYYERKNEWEQASVAMATILSQMGNAVSQAHDSYQAAEASNQRIWR
ncbi:MAG: WXG100 family type VII secretion target [Actinobacteria bacterium]|nr:WXG100 family type VII secretion target [Actinomycetota bacterium]MBI3686526.1 WXG100 family type VII secretion target [Actinomycetota bacterium]